MMNEQEAIATFLDQFEAEQLRTVQANSRDRTAQAYYGTVMGVMYEVRKFLKERTPT